MNASRLLLAALVLAVSLPAEAGRRGHRHSHVVARGPAVHLHVNPWGPAYVPAARAGWVWVAGYYVGARWFPGYWRPAVARLGWLWVPGYWAGAVYVDGYWREEGRVGQVWVEGYYDDDDNWVPGYWAPAGSADARHDDAGSDASRVTVPDSSPPETPSASDDVHHDYD